MKSYFKYIYKQISENFLGIALILTSVMWLARSLNYVDLIINKGMSLLSFLWYAGLIIPQIFALIMPMVTFISIIYTYYKLWSDSELVVMKSAGLSNFHIALPAVIFGFTVAIFVILIELYIAPANYSRFKNLQSDMRNKFVASILQEGSFQSPMENITVYIGSRLKDGTLFNILVHDQRGEEENTVIARKGLIESNDSGLRFVALDGNRQTINRKTKRVSILHFEKYAFDIGNININKPRYRKSQERSLDELLNPPDGTPLKYVKLYKAEAHRRLIAPLIVILLASLAVIPTTIGYFTRRFIAKRVVLVGFLAFSTQAFYIATPGILAQSPNFKSLPYVFCLISITIVWFLMLNEGQKTPKYYFLNLMKKIQ